jgi:hypothetical protein
VRPKFHVKLAWKDADAVPCRAVLVWLWGMLVPNQQGLAIDTIFLIGIFASFHLALRVGRPFQAIQFVKWAMLRLHKRVQPNS